MDSVGGHQSSSGGVDGAAPFLVKTYEMIDDSSTDDIVSWNPNNKNSFVVWNSLEFARLLLPSHFKHNNFSSFIRQLNIYGFGKIDQKRWEFANEDFIKGQKHLLKNIHRKKPIHNHSQPHGSLGDIERSAFEEEIEKLTQEKVALRTKLLKFEHEKLEMKLQVEELMNKIHDMEQEQLKMTNFLTKAAENPTFMDQFVKMAGSHLDLSAFHKKRRLLGSDFVQEVADISFVDSSSLKLDSGHMFSRDFSNSLRLELSPALSDSNVVSVSSQSSSGDGGSPQNRTSEGDLKDSSTRRECLSFEPEMEEPLGMGISFAVRKDVSVSEPVRVNDFSSIDEGHRLMSCHLNLTLASSSLLQGNIDHCPAKFPGLGQEVISSNELRSSGSDGREAELGVSSTNRKLSDDYPTLSSSQQATEVSNIHGSGAPKGRVNDVFWEQFLTERPGPTDVEKASSSIRANPENEQEERNNEHGNSRRNKQDMEQLSL